MASWTPSRTLSDNVDAFAALSDDELVERVKHLAACERRASVALIRSLVEFDARRLYLREGCSSLFTYCTQVLHLSEGSAYNRIETARAARRYPKVLEALERGDLTLTAVRLLAPHLTPANHGEVLAAARHRSKQGIQELIASLNPRPAAATMIRRVAPQPSKGDSATTFAVAQEHEISIGNERSSRCVGCTRRYCDASASAPCGRRHATRAGTLQATGDAVARDARKAAARAGARPTYAAGWRRRLDPRSRIDAADRPSRAAQVCPCGVTAAELGRESCIGTSYTGGRQACSVAAR